MERVTVTIRNHLRQLMACKVPAVNAKPCGLTWYDACWAYVHNVCEWVGHLTGDGDGGSSFWSGEDLGDGLGNGDGFGYGRTFWGGGGYGCGPGYGHGFSRGDGLGEGDGYGAGLARGGGYGYGYYPCQHVIVELESEW